MNRFILTFLFVWGLLDCGAPPAPPEPAPIDCSHPPPNFGGCDGVEPDAGPPSNPCNDAGAVWQQDDQGNTYCAPYDGGR